jgi:tetratricopeptide (TPR) repeat protein
MVAPTTRLLPLIVRAGELEQGGRFFEAETVLREALTFHSVTPELATRLASYALRRGDTDAAVNYFTMSLKENPGDAIRRANLGAMYLRANRPDKALHHLLFADKKEPRTPEILQNLVQAYFLMGRTELAIRTCGRLLALNPNHADALIDLAKCHDVMGEVETARSTYAQALQIDPRSAEAYDGWVRSQKFETLPAQFGALDALLKEPVLAPRERFILHLAAGKILDDLGRRDEAFEQFRLGNACRQAKDISAAQQRLDAKRRTFGKAFFDARKGFGLPNRRPVFVVGMPRSGTTLVEQVLASHPQVYGANELPFMADVVRKLGAGRDQNFAWAEMISAQHAKAVASEYLELLKALSAGARRVTDKLPLNFEHLWLIALTFPNAAIVHCERDAMDTCWSCFTNPLGLLHLGTDLPALAQSYQLYQEMMAHWRAVLPLNILDLRYEAFVSDPEPQIRKLLAFVGLEWHPACLHPERTERSVRTPSRWQVRRQINTGAIGSWRRYEKHLGPLQAALASKAAPLQD